MSDANKRLNENHYNTKLNHKRNSNFVESFIAQTRYEMTLKFEEERILQANYQKELLEWEERQAEKKWLEQKRLAQIEKANAEAAFLKAQAELQQKEEKALLALKLAAQAIKEAEEEALRKNQELIERERKLREEQALLEASRLNKRLYLQILDGIIEYQFENEKEWHTLLSLTELFSESIGVKAVRSDEIFDLESSNVDANHIIEFRINRGVVQWCAFGTSEWYDLVSLIALVEKPEEEIDKTHIEVTEQLKDIKPVEFTIQNGEAKWRYVGKDNWQTMITLNAINNLQYQEENDSYDEDAVVDNYATKQKSSIVLETEAEELLSTPDIEEIESRVVDGIVQWRYKSDTIWHDMIAFKAILDTDTLNSDESDVSELDEDLLIVFEQDADDSHLTDASKDLQKVEFRRQQNVFQWRYDEAEWKNLLILYEKECEERDNVEVIQFLEEEPSASQQVIPQVEYKITFSTENSEFRLQDSYIQWYNTSSECWLNLVALDTLQGVEETQFADNIDDFDYDIILARGSKSVDE